MKDIYNKSNKKSLIQSIIYKILINLCWFLFCTALVIFVNDIFNKEKLIILILSMFSIYVVRIIIEHFYKRVSDNAYNSIKHSSEMYYFKKLDKLNPSVLEKIDREYLYNKILEITYNITRMINDIFEYCVPCVLGLIIFYVVLAQVNIFLVLISIVLLGLLLFFEYKKYKYNDVSFNNDLLKDFILKLPDIRMLNVFSFCSKRLDKYESKICILRHKVKYDIVFDLGAVTILLVAIIPSIFILKNPIDIIGVTAFFVMLGIGLKELVFNIVPTIKNIEKYNSNNKELEEYLGELKQEKYINEWKKINIKNASYIYESGVEIKIPNFEFLRGDNVSILGATGMGKSTLLYILSGIYKLNDGETYVDEKLTNSSINSMYITRNTKLFKLSLRDNLLLDNKMSDEDLIKLINEIDIKEWYESLANGLDTIIDINYIDLPDQVREKINILRGIISNKDTLLLDEPTFDLDMDSEKIIANMIKKYWKKKSYIIVTHRPIFTTICKKHYFMKNHQLLESEPLL